jgi:hypothetical protein
MIRTWGGQIVRENILGATRPFFGMVTSTMESRHSIIHSCRGSHDMTSQLQLLNDEAEGTDPDKQGCFEGRTQRVPRLICKLELPVHFQSHGVAHRMDIPTEFYSLLLNLKKRSGPQQYYQDGGMLRPWSVWKPLEFRVAFGDPQAYKCRRHAIRVRTRRT